MVTPDQMVPGQPAASAAPSLPLAPQPGAEGLARPEQLLAAIEYEDDEEEDEDSVLERLPRDTKLLREYITASQGFLLLLTLRQHLKDLYGFTDAKISQYSPSESAKVYEKAVNRKSNQQFKPKATLARLEETSQRMRELDEELDDDGRLQLVKEYLDFKQLVLKFDHDEPEEEDEEATPSKRNAHRRVNDSSEADRAEDGAAGAAPTIQYQVSQVVDAQSQGGPPRVPKLTIHASHHHQQHHHEKEHRRHWSEKHKPEKPKKHKKKKKRRLSDSSESDDFSDPDFCV